MGTAVTCPSPGGDPRRAVTSQTLGDIPRRSAARWPERTAIIHRDVTLTFAEFDLRIDDTAALLHESGVRAGDRVMILSHNCWQFPAVIFAAARLGALAVPVNFMLTAREVTYLVDDCTPAVIIVEDELVPIANEALAARTGTSPVLTLSIGLTGTPPPAGWADLDDELGHDRPAAPDVIIDDDAPIRIMYTSGTESSPKGVLHSSRTLTWQYMSCIVSGGMESHDVEVHALPLYHCAQLDNFLITDIILGATSLILDRPDPTAILDAVERIGATNLFCPPTLWVDMVERIRARPHAAETLRKGYYGASALPNEVLSEMRALLPDLRLWNFYGQTEMGSLATVLPPEEQDRRQGSAGRAVINVTTAIVDENSEILPPGRVGEIVHRSPQVTLGYHNLPERTAESLQGGWFHSGDLGYLDNDGYLWVVDRKKDMIKSGGENVASREVEEVLFTIPEIREAAVYGVPHPKWIEAVVATVVPVDGARIDPDTVIAACRTMLAGYKVPKCVLVANALPKNPSGKIVKRTLRETFSGSW